MDKYQHFLKFSGAESFCLKGSLSGQLSADFSLNSQYPS